MDALGFVVIRKMVLPCVVVDDCDHGVVVVVVVVAVAVFFVVVVVVVPPFVVVTTAHRVAASTPIVGRDRPGVHQWSVTVASRVDTIRCPVDKYRASTLPDAMRRPPSGAAVVEELVGVTFEFLPRRVINSIEITIALKRLPHPTC